MKQLFLVRNKDHKGYVVLATDSETAKQTVYMATTNALEDLRAIAILPGETFANVAVIG